MLYGTDPKPPHLPRPVTLPAQNSSSPGPFWCLNRLCSATSQVDVGHKSSVAGHDLAQVAHVDGCDWNLRLITHFPILWNFLEPTVAECSDGRLSLSRLLSIFCLLKIRLVRGTTWTSGQSSTECRSDHATHCHDSLLVP